MLVSLIKDLFKSSAQQDHGALATASQLIDRAQYASASAILDVLLQRSPVNPDALLMRAVAKLKMGKPREALDDLMKPPVVQAAPGDCHFQMAMCWTMLGDTVQALQHCETARQLAPDSATVFSLLMQLKLPGEYYSEVLQKIHSCLSPKTYVEIGVFQGETLTLAQSASAVVGIDPDPKIEFALPPHFKMFKSTSDAFFAGRDLHAELGGRTVDLAFIDGMHQFEFAMRDFANLERHARKDSVILLHDCYPLDERSAGREPLAHSWCGDVWRLIVLLKKYRPDLVIHTIGAYPSGLGVIQNLDPQSTFLLDNQDNLYKEFLALDFSYLDDDKPFKLNLFPNEWPAIERMLRNPAV